MCINYIFIHSSVNEHLVCIHLLDIVNNAVTNISVQIPESLLSLLGTYTGMELLDHTLNLGLVFEDS